MFIKTILDKVTLDQQNASFGTWFVQRWKHLRESTHKTKMTSAINCTSGWLKRTMRADVRLTGRVIILLAEVDGRLYNFITTS